jgi:hypothetical protein
MGRPSRRAVVSFAQRMHGFAGILRFTAFTSAISPRELPLYFSSAAVCFAVRTTGK